MRRIGSRLVITLALTTALAGGALSVTSSTASAVDGRGQSSSDSRGDDSDQAPPPEPGSDGGAESGQALKPVAFTRQVTMNVRFNMGARKHAADIHAAARKADVVGWQEITEWSQMNVIAGLRGWQTYWPAGRRSRDGKISRDSANANPISWRGWMWKLVGRGSQLTSRELPGICRDRYLTWVKLQHRRSGKVILRWNIHFVPNAMNDRKVRLKWRRRVAWNRQRDAVDALVTRFSADPGIDAVIGGGDINWRDEFLGDRVAYDTRHQEIDYLTHVPEADIRSWRPKFQDAYSDHEKVTVPYTLFR